MTAQETDLNFHYIKDVKPIIDEDFICFESNYQTERKLEDLPIEEDKNLFNSL